MPRTGGTTRTIERVTPRTTLRLAALAALLATGCAGVFRTGAATVNGHVITDDQVQRQLDLALTDPSIDVQLGTGSVREGRLREATRQLLAILVQQRIVQEYADGNGIEVPDGEVEDLLAQTVESQGGQEAFRAALEKRGLTIGDVRDNLEQLLLYRHVQRDVVESAVSEAELRAAYDERESEFTELHLSIIVLSSQEDAARVAARATPSNFARLARRESVDQASGPNGGDLGFVRPGDVPAEVAAAALRAPDDRVGGPVATEGGFVVFIVRARRVIPFADVKDQLLAERSAEVFETWLTGRLRHSRIVVNPRYGRLDLATGRIVAITSTEDRATEPIQLTP